MNEIAGTDALIFVHGIVGNNRIFDFLQLAVSSRYEVIKVELKGHGSDALSFSRASMTEWKKQVEEAIIELHSEGRKILGVGHSMGCLLLMEQAVKGEVERLIPFEFTTSYPATLLIVF